MVLFITALCVRCTYVCAVLTVCVWCVLSFVRAVCVCVCV